MYNVFLLTLTFELVLSWKPGCQGKPTGITAFPSHMSNRIAEVRAECVTSVSIGQVNNTAHVARADIVASLAVIIYNNILVYDSRKTLAIRALNCMYIYRRTYRFDLDWMS